jgi:hypothetical protein
MMRAARCCALLGALVWAYAPLSAQTAQDRDLQRFWIHLNLGYGTANVSCDSCGTGPRLDGATYGLELGGTVSPSMRLGGLFEAWTHQVGDATEYMENVGLVMYYYPSVSSGLFLKGSVGFASYHASGIPAIDGTGWGYSGGLGYEFPIGSSVTLIPFADYVVGHVGELDFSDGSGAFATGWNQNFVAVGLSFGFYPSRHRRY